MCQKIRTLNYQIVMLRPDGSSSSEQDFAGIISKISEQYRIQSTKQDSISSNITRFFDMRSYEMCKLNELVVQTEYKHPQNVLDAAERAQIRLFFGTFPEINLCYCVVDSKLFYWKKGDRNAKYYQENGDYISSVIINKPDEEVFYSKNVKCVLAIATNTTISIIPIKIDSVLFSKDLNRSEDYLDLVHIITTNKHRFVCSTLCPSNGKFIFAGSDTGSVYVLKYSVDKTNSRNRKIKYSLVPNIPYKYKVLNYALNYAPPFISGRSGIVQLCYEHTQGYLAALDEDSNIRFFGVSDEDHIYELESLVGDNKESIVRLIPVPTSESERIRFIGVTKQGARLKFAALFDPIEMTFTITLMQQRMMNESNGFPMLNNVLDAVSVLNNTVIITKNQICYLMFQTVSEDQANPVPEKFVRIPSSENCLSLQYSNHILQSYQINAFKDSFGWQHISEVPAIELCTNRSIKVITFKRPVDQLASYIVESNGNYTPKIYNWMKKNQEDSGATALLLASENESMKLQALFILSQFAKSEFKLRDDFDTNLQVSSRAFLLRTCVIFEPTWSSSVFETSIKKRDGQTIEKFKVASVYEDYTTDFIITQLKNVSKLISEYKRILVTLKNDIKKDDKTDNQNEGIFLFELASYVNTMIEVYTFIEIASKQKKSFITSAINLLDAPYRQRLVEQKLGDQNAQISIVDSLRELSLKMMFSNGGKADLGHELRSRCQSFFTLEDSQLLTALDELKRCPPNSPTLDRIVDTILKYVNRAVNLADVCSKLVELKNYKAVVDICLARAAAVDPSQKALQWFKGQRLKTDEEGRSAFDRRYRCYEVVFNLLNEQKAFDVMVTTNDELFHLCLYQRVFAMHKQETLLQRNTPFIEEYLQEFAPSFIHVYRAAHKEYGSAAVELLKMATTSPNPTLDQRIEYLADVAKYSLAGGMTDMLNDVRVKQHLAKIQKILCQRTGAVRNLLMDSQKLLNECTNAGQWDLVIRLVSAVPVQTAQQDQLISQIWTNMLVEQLWNYNLSNAAAYIIECISQKSDTAIDVLKPSVVVPVLEEYKMNHSGEPLWAEDTLVKCGARPQEMFNAYYTILEKPNLTNEVRAEYTYAAIKLTSIGVRINQKQYENLKKWIGDVGRGFPFFNDALKLLSEIPK